MTFERIFVFALFSLVGGCAEDDSEPTTSDDEAQCESFCQWYAGVARDIGCSPLDEAACRSACLGSVEEAAGCTAENDSFNDCFMTHAGAESCLCEATDGDINCEATFKDNEHPSGVAPCSAEATTLSECIGG